MASNNDTIVHLLMKVMGNKRSKCNMKEEFHFHKIPKHKKQRKKWLLAIKREEGKLFIICIFFSTW